MGLSVSTEDAMCEAGEKDNRICKMLHLQLRLQAGRGGETSAWQLQHGEGKQDTMGEQKYLIPRGCLHPNGLSSLVVREEKGRVPACKVARVVAA